MTFSQSVKNEILKSVRNAKKCCATSFLTAVLKSVGSLTLGHGGYAFSVESDNVDFLSIIAELAARLEVKSRLSSYNMSAKGTAVYSCRFDSSLGEKLGLVTRDEEGTLGFAEAESLIPSEPCCRRAFMQGLFVSCGSVIVPNVEGSDRAKYHLELRFSDAEFARAVNMSYATMGLRQTPRKNHTVLYIKESELIADFLVYVNATSAKLELENVIVIRSVRNDVNRQSNCEFANIEKTVAASAKQLQAIELLRSSGRFDLLSDSLKQIALLREEDREATLEEIAAKLHISKSGANHRFAKLIELAEQQRKKL